MGCSHSDVQPITVQMGMLRLDATLQISLLSVAAVFQSERGPGVNRCQATRQG